MEVLVPCSECEFFSRDIYSFNVHFKVSHQTCCKYICKIEGCHRPSFDKFHSFREHLRSTHRIPVFANSKQNVRNSNDNVVEVDLVSQNFIPSDSSNDLNLGDELVVDVFDMLLQQQDCLVAQWYSNPSLPRNIIDSLISAFSNYVTSPFFEVMRDKVLSSLDPSLSSDARNEIVKMFDFFMSPFNHLKTEYKRLQYFETCGEYIAPVSYEIFSREEKVKTKDGVRLKMMEVTGQFIPLRSVLSQLFHLPFVLEDTLRYMSSLSKETDWLFNFSQCDTWKRKLSRFSPQDIVIPLNIYYDDFEPNSALGPHCEPLGCTYVQIATFPPECNSKLENIFLALLFNAHDRSLYGNKRAFRPLISELLHLEREGIEVETKEKGKVKIYFVVALVLGDNKGLNGICGFMEGFTATYFCRVCKCTKKYSETQYDENLNLLRTAESYAADVAKSDPSTTGIKEECIFNRLPSFQTPDDICVDEFHDLAEGLAHYTLVPVLKHFHKTNSMFIPTLNNRLHVMDLGVDSDNRPPPINTDRLFSKDKLKMTGAEMYTFIRVFGVLVHDMVPQDDPYYALYLLLFDITSIVNAKSLPRDAGVILAIKVREHHQLYVELTKETLKPKHHFLLHYSRMLSDIGPFGLLSTIRFEAKHRLLKHTANVCMSRVNLPCTVAIKQQLSFCFRCVSRKSFRPATMSGPCHPTDLKTLETYPSFSLSLPYEIFEKPVQDVVKWVDFKGTLYKPKQILLVDTDENGLFEFAEIDFILLCAGEPLFICSSLETIGYISEVRGYEVKRVTDAVAYYAFPPNLLLDPHPLTLYPLPSGDTVVVLKYVL